MVLRYCAGPHDAGKLINAQGEQTHCCEECASPTTDPCPCDEGLPSTPHMGSLPPNHPMAKK